EVACPAPRTRSRNSPRGNAPGAAAQKEGGRRGPSAGTFPRTKPRSRPSKRGDDGTSLARGRRGELVLRLFVPPGSLRRTYRERGVAGSAKGRRLDSAGGRVCRPAQVLPAQVSR